MSALLLVTAAGLGLLAFFEPCTIATHTLFAARSSRDAAQRRRAALVQLVIARSALLAGIFGAAAAIGLDELAVPYAAFMLGIIGTVYLVSRRVYLPLPHLEGFRLVPGGHALPQAVQLGLTLPACTLPLVAVVGVIAALNQRIDAALGAGLVFAGMFSLPTVWDSLHGLSQAHRIFLGKAAAASPGVTALLLWSGAILLWHTGTDTWI
jgi:cytochrome c-type biogenesis protein